MALRPAPSGRCPGRDDLLQLRRRLLARRDPPPVPFLLRAGSHAVAVGHGEPAFEVAVRTARGLAALLSLRQLDVADAYIAGDVDLDGDLFVAMSLRAVLSDHQPGVRLWAWTKPALLGRTRCDPGWVAKHYDAGNIQLVASDRRYHVYTPGLYEDDGDTLEDGAVRKLEAAFRSLRLASGSSVLDVGCGWGGFARFCAERGVAVTGLTLSRHQLAFARARLRDDGLDACLLYADFFSFTPRRRFDGISLMGVLEDLSDYGRVMERVAAWLAPGGRVYADFSAGSSPFGVSTFITKHVWPGRFRPVYLPDFTRAVARSRLEVLELHNDRRNYRRWVRMVHDRWVEHRDEVVARAGEETWRTFRLLCAGVVATMEDGGRNTAYRVVLAPRG